MRRRATIKAVYTLCEKALGGKAPAEYTSYEHKLRFQRSVLRNTWQMYDQFVLNQSCVLEWIVEYDRNGGDNKIIADTWRWCLGINKKLPVKIQKQR